MLDQKDVNLRALKNGQGYTTSYTVSIGSKEARDCGFTDPNVQLVKIVDVENKQIIFKIKGE